jgi:hypothetical protein
VVLICFCFICFVGVFLVLLGVVVRVEQRFGRELPRHDLGGAHGFPEGDGSAGSTTFSSSCSMVKISKRHRVDLDLRGFPPALLNKRSQTGGVFL